MPLNPSSLLLAIIAGQYAVKAFQSQVHLEDACSRQFNDSKQIYDKIIGVYQLMWKLLYQS